MLLFPLLLASFALAARPDPSSAARQEPLPESPAERDARVSFNAESAARARAVLAAGPLEVEARALALVALGGGRVAGDLARIEAALAGDEPLERRAAAFALGEMGPAGLPGLERALAGSTEGLEDALSAALLVAARSGASAASERLDALALGEDPIARHAALAVAYRNGLAETYAPLDEYRDLRWRAARAYGLLDGQRASSVLVTQLFATADFRERVVVTAAAELPPPELATHLFEMLHLDERPAVLRVAALRFPSELARAFQAGEWKPSLPAWHVVLAEIDAAHAERRAQELLEIAFLQAPELEPRAGLLLVRAGGDLPWRWVADQLETGSASVRAALAQACGDRGEPARIPDLAELLARRPDLGIFGEGLVALTRLGHGPARSELDGLLTGPPSIQRTQAAAALARVLHDPPLRARAEKLLRRDDLEPELRLELELALALAGGNVPHAPLRAALSGVAGRASLAPPDGTVTAPEDTHGDTHADAHEPAAVAPDDLATPLRLVRALARRPEPGDLELLTALFPSGDPELDVELALALLRHRHPAVSGLLRASLWNDAWNVSVLAGGLIVKAGGPRALSDELEAAPLTVAEEDLRRVGFALGLWGGIGAVEELARTRTERDPALQGALLGALAGRASEPLSDSPKESKKTTTISPPDQDDEPAKILGGGLLGGRKKKPQ